MASKKIQNLPQAISEDLKAKTKVQSPLKTSENVKEGKGPKTRVIIKYDVGYANDLYLRGKGADLSWTKGVKLKNVKPDEWVWETDVPFLNCEFKVLINDQIYETGENHPLHCGSCISYTPHFE